MEAGPVIAIIAGLGLFIAASSLLGWRFKKTRTEFGSARWLTIFEALKAGLFKDTGLMIGDWAGHLPIFYDGTHSITFGAAGSGKGACVIIPGLLRNRFIFLNDPGGENTAVAIKSWRDRNLDIFIINPFGLHAAAPWSLPSHRFNPFAFIDPASASFSADAKVCAQLIMQRSGDETGSSKFFVDTAENFIHALIIHIVTNEPQERRNAATLCDYVNCDRERWSALLEAMKKNPAASGFVSRTADDMERRQALSPGEFSGVMSTASQFLAWLNDENTRRTVSGNDVDFAALKGGRPNQRGAVVAVVLPVAYKESHKTLTRLAMQCAVWALTRGAIAREKVIFEIDEAASLGRVEPLPQWLAELRKYKIQWSLHFQNVGQLRHLYRAESQTFQGNAGLKRIVGVRDLETAEEVSRFCGASTIAVVSRGPGGASTSLARRELKMCDEVLRLKDDEMIAFIDNKQSARLKKTFYWDRVEFQGAYNPNPFIGGLTAAGADAAWKELWGRLVYVAAWVMLPHPIVSAIITAMIAVSVLITCS